MSNHFNTAYDQRKISSDLIVEVCEDVASGMRTATLQPLNKAGMLGA